MPDVLAARDPKMFFLSVIEDAIKAAIDREVRQRMPAIVAAACAEVAMNVDTFMQVNRIGQDLQISILNAFKAEETDK